MASKLIWQRSHQGAMRSKEAAIERYHQHVEEIKAAVPADQLLIFQVDQGWEPLCKFVGAEVPDDTPFPNVNDRAEVKKTIAGITNGAYVFLFIGLLILIGIIFGLVKLLG
jgi:hypothetical protein